MIVSRLAEDDAAVAPDTASHEPVRGARIAAAGDIACAPTSSSFHDGEGSGRECRQMATSDLLVEGRYAAVLALGDVQYDDGAEAEFSASYDPSWGRVRAITRPAVGNHEYRTTGAAGYFGYFGEAAGSPAAGYYSFDLAGWHLVALNSNCSQVGGCEDGSTQERWLRRDLAASDATCTLAYWHHPRFSSGPHGSDRTYVAFWRALTAAGADIVLVAHDHDYERFAPLTSDGRLDLERGIRQFVVGTGGRGLRGFAGRASYSEVRDARSFGVLELTLGRGAYAWRFRAAIGSLADSGSYRCH